MSQQVTENTTQPQKNKQYLVIPKRSLVFKWPILTLLVIDAVFTIIGQTEAYWSQQKPAESNPVIHHLLGFSSNIVWVVVIFGLYFVLVDYLLNRTRSFINITLRLAFFLGHFTGAILWYIILYERFLREDLTQGWFRLLFIGGFILVISLISFVPPLVAKIQTISLNSEEDPE
jgi:hypothetical protein